MDTMIILVLSNRIRSTIRIVALDVDASKNACSIQIKFFIEHSEVKLGHDR